MAASSARVTAARTRSSSETVAGAGCEGIGSGSDSGVDFTPNGANCGAATGLAATGTDFGGTGAASASGSTANSGSGSAATAPLTNFGSSPGGGGGGPAGRRSRSSAAFKDKGPTRDNSAFDSNGL